MPDWNKILEDEQAGRLPPQQAEALQRLRAQGQAPAPRPHKESKESTGHWLGRGALEVGPPVLAAILSRGQSLIKQALTIGTSAALGETAGRLLLPKPGTPESRGEVTPVLKEATRTGLETIGAVYGGGVIGPAPTRAGMGRRIVQGVGRVAGTAVGAGAGSLAAEPIDPSLHPVERAADTAKIMAAWTLGFEAGGGIGRKIFGRSRLLSTEGEQAAETLAREKLVIPFQVSQSRGGQVLSDIGTEAVTTGTRRNTELARAEQTLSQRVAETLREAKRPRDPVVQAEMEAQGYQHGLSGEARARNTKQTTDLMYAALDDMNRQAFHATGQPLPMVGTQHAAGDVVGYTLTGTPEHTALTRLALAPTLSLAEAEALYRRLSAWRPPATLPVQIGERLYDALDALRKSIDDPVYIDMTPLRQTIRRLRQQVQGSITPSVDHLITQATTAPYRMSLGDARTLRSELMEIARSYEPGGGQRVSTAMGQRPQVGTGRRFASTLQREAQGLARSVNNAIVRSMGRMDRRLPHAWRMANAAYQVGVRAADLERFLTTPALLDPQTGMYQGKAMLDWMARRANRGQLRALETSYGSSFLPNLREFANALKVLQDVREPYTPRIGHRLMHMGPRTLQIMAGAGTAAAGHPIAGAFIGLPALVMPEVLGVILSSPTLTKNFILGIRGAEHSAAAWRALGRVAGALTAHGVLAEDQVHPHTTRTPATGVAPTPPAPSLPAGQSRAERATEFYRTKLRTTSRQHAEQFWHESMQRSTDDEVRQAYLNAFVEQYGTQPGVR